MLKFLRDILKEFEPVGKNAKVILFGSLARGDYRLDSDIDLAIVTNDSDLIALASSIANKILFDYGKVVSLKFIKEEELFQESSPFINEIKKGIIVYEGKRRHYRGPHKRGA